MRAAIDIGSNSLLLTVVDGDRVLHDEARVVGMARGLGDGGRFREDRKVAARAVLTEYVARAEALGVPAHAIRAVATSGARRASDADSFFEALRAETGLSVRTVSGEEEARLSFLGARSGLDCEGPVLVVDLGGGSTELVFGDESPEFAVSLEVGAVRLTEDVAPEDRADHLRTTLFDLRLPRVPAETILVAGTATTLSAIRLGLEFWDGDAVHDSTLRGEDLERLRDRFDAASPGERLEMARIAPERAPYLGAGAAILAAVLRCVSVPKARVSDRGLRFGLLL